MDRGDGTNGGSTDRRRLHEDWKRAQGAAGSKSWGIVEESRLEGQWERTFNALPDLSAILDSRHRIEGTRNEARSWGADGRQLRLR